MNENGAAAAVIARQTLADELSCDPEAIRIVGVEPVEWRDSSLGCPQAGMMYMQVITPGYRIMLEHAGQQYVFHTDNGRRAIHCTAPDATTFPFTL